MNGQWRVGCSIDDQVEGSRPATGAGSKRALPFPLLHGKQSLLRHFRQLQQRGVSWTNNRTFSIESSIVTELECHAEGPKLPNQASIRVGVLEPKKISGEVELWRKPPQKEAVLVHPTRNFSPRASAYAVMGSVCIYLCRNSRVTLLYSIS